MFNSGWALYLKALAWELCITSGQESDVTTDGCTGEKLEEQQKMDHTSMLHCSRLLISNLTVVKQGMHHKRAGITYTGELKCDFEDCR